MTRDEFWGLVAQAGPAECWLYAGQLQSDGYARVWVDSRPIYAHRVAFEALVGPVADDLVVDHLCEVRHCVNPVHLEAVTQAENIKRSYSRREAYLARRECLHGHDWSGLPDQPRHCRECDRLRKVRSRSAQLATAH